MYEESTELENREGTIDFVFNILCENKMKKWGNVQIKLFTKVKDAI